jgi:hypothetical protein
VVDRRRMTNNSVNCWLCLVALWQSNGITWNNRRNEATLRRTTSSMTHKLGESLQNSPKSSVGLRSPAFQELNGSLKRKDGGDLPFFAHNSARIDGYIPPEDVRGECIPHQDPDLPVETPFAPLALSGSSGTSIGCRNPQGVIPTLGNSRSIVGCPVFVADGSPRLSRLCLQPYSGGPPGYRWPALRDG